jgi:hypothetical protein
MIQEPCRLLRDADGAMNFVAADTVLAVHNLPHGRQPLVQTDGSGLPANLFGEYYSGCPNLPKSRGAPNGQSSSDQADPDHP